MAWVEQYALWVRAGAPALMTMPARDIDAMLTLDRECATDAAEQR